MIKTFCILIMLLTLQFTKGQDSTYVQDFSHRLNIRTGIDANTFSYKFSNPDTKMLFHLKPNQNGRLTLGVVYRYMVLNFGYGPDAFQDELKGESDIQFAQLRFFTKRFLHHVSYTNLKGFYLENTSDFVPNWTLNEDPYITYGNFRVKRLKAKTSFVLNKDFSYKAIIAQSQKQLKSQGSFMPTVSYYYSKLQNPKSFGISVSDETNHDLNFTLGYIHTFVFGKNKNYFASVNLSNGLGVKRVDSYLIDSAIKKEETFTNIIFDGGLDFGYNAEKMFTGVKFNASSVSYNRNPETNIENSNSYIHLYFGYRFGAPKPLSRIFDGIQKIFS